MNVVVIFADLMWLLLGFTQAHVSLLFGEGFSALSADALLACLRFWLLVDRFLEDRLLLIGRLSLDVCFVGFNILRFFVESVSFGDFRVFLERVMVILRVVLKPDFHVLQSSV